MCCPSAANNKYGKKAWTEATQEKEMVSLWFEVLLLHDKFQILAANWLKTLLRAAFNIQNLKFYY